LISRGIVISVLIMAIISIIIGFVGIIISAVFANFFENTLVSCYNDHNKFYGDKDHSYYVRKAHVSQKRI
jgi:hypothetical protein